MTNKQKLQQNAERFVEDVIKNTFKQEVHSAQVKKAARKASKAIPSTPAKRTEFHAAA